MNPHTEMMVSLCKRQKRPQSFLFVGHNLHDKKRAAQEMAEILFCVSKKEGRACLSCVSCKKLEKGVHPDLMIVRPKNQEIVIEQVRSLQRWLSVRPNEAELKIVFVEEAEALNKASSNAFLKTLEEPPIHALLILSVASPQSLLPTVRSRLIVIRFPTDLTKMTIPNTERPEWVDGFERLLQTTPPVDPSEIFACTETLSKNRDDLLWFFSVLYSKIRDTLKAKAEEGRMDHSVTHLESLCSLAVQTEYEVSRRYANVALSLDHLMLQWFSRAT